MVSLLILAVVVGWVALWVYVFKHAPNRSVRIGAVLVAVLIPFWDLPIGYFNLQRHCSTEGGMRTYERIAPQDKVYFKSVPGNSVNELLKQDFKVVEILRPDGKDIAQHEIQGGQITSRTVKNPTSSIAISITRNEKLAWNIYRDQELAHSLATNKLLAEFTRFSWHGGWLQEATWPLVRGSVDCFFQRTDPLVTVLQHGS